MVGRRAFTVAGLTAVALGAWQQGASGQVPAAKSAGGHEHGEMSDACAKACSDCQRECESCAAHCADQLESGKKDHATTLATCLDCAAFCATAASIVARGGPFSALICKACVDACAMCGKECEKFPDDKHMKECAAECRKCEKTCKEMVAHAGHDHGTK
ncbi:four-helix bundle copper-binding protein [Anatilimnocola floriformis]|uniref:four-helix bundle copper-binding protein n=1 Tax=Anatilimnocola floriformis TaxID=2948575 RepID=UPI0020C27E7B|nr:four-helix bundle copper-binding protein [Anatilimnocola floriformis]